MIFGIEKTSSRPREAYHAFEYDGTENPLNNLIRFLNIFVRRINWPEAKSFLYKLKNDLLLVKNGKMRYKTLFKPKFHKYETLSQLVKNWRSWKIKAAPDFHIFSDSYLKRKSTEKTEDSLSKAIKKRRFVMKDVWLEAMREGKIYF